MVQGKRLAKIEKLRQLNAVDFIFVAYLLGVVLIMVVLGWGHKYFNQVIITHIVFTVFILVFAYYVGFGSHPALKFVRAWYPILLLIYLYSESGLINNLVFEAPLDPIYISMDKLIFHCEPAMVLPVKFSNRFLSQSLRNFSQRSYKYLVFKTFIKLLNK